MKSILASLFKILIEYSESSPDLAMKISSLRWRTAGNRASVNLLNECQSIYILEAEKLRQFDL